MMKDNISVFVTFWELIQNDYLQLLISIPLHSGIVTI